MNFLKTFTRYDVVVIADDNGVRHPGCVQVSDAACAAAGFSDMNFTIGKKVSGWEKALFYLSQKNYERVWFLEEDVFVQDEAALLAIDRKYAGDLLCNTISANAGDKTDWHWPLIQIRTPPPYYCAMCCAGIAPTASTNRRVRAGLPDALFSGSVVPDAVRRLVGSKPPRIGEYYLPGRIRPSGSAILVPPRKKYRKAR